MERDQQNVAILLTPPGAAAIAVIRLIGPRTRSFLETHFSREAPVGRCVHGKLSDGQIELDDPVVVLLPDGRGADINLHGGIWVVRSAMELARKAGFEVIASQPPLAFEAVDGQSLIEREVLTHLPLARTELGLRVLLAQTQAWAQLGEMLAKMPPGARRERILAILSDRSLHCLLYPPRVAIVGAANVGKSTLANHLFGQDRSITADVEGTTRDWVGEIADVNGLPVMLLDTPGLRQTHDPIEQAAITLSQTEISTADLLIIVLDASRRFEPDQARLLSDYPTALRVLNKADLASDHNDFQQIRLKTIATTGSGLDELRDQICAHFGCKRLDVNQARCWTERQRLELMEPGGLLTS